MSERKTEGWLTLVIIGLCFVALMFDKITGGEFLTGISIPGTGYILSRTTIKAFMAKLLNLNNNKESVNNGEG